METGQHTIQDSCEAYAVYVMQKAAEDPGRAAKKCSDQRWVEFADYLAKSKLTINDFETGEFAKYKRNVDLQVSVFVERLAKHYKASDFVFENVEAAARNDGMKADVHIHVTGRAEPCRLASRTTSAAEESPGRRSPAAPSCPSPAVSCVRPDWPWQVRGPPADGRSALLHG